MTVVERPARPRAATGTADAGELAATRLRGLVADGPGARLASVTVAAADLDAARLFATARAAGLAPTLWAQPLEGTTFVGIGESWAVEPAGADRFARAAAAWADLAGGARVSDDAGTARGTGPLLVGGFAFDHAGGTDAKWAGFGPGRLVLPRILWTRTREGSWLTLNDVGTGEEPQRSGGRDRTDAAGLAVLWSRLAAAATADEDRSGPSAQPATLRVVGGAPTADEWRATVDRYAGAVGRGRVDKVVLARRVDLASDRSVDVAGAIRTLVSTAPESTVFAIARGDAVFLGATPERLVRTEGTDARTVAIAGTAPRGADAAEDEALAAALLADEKEREEHAVVVRMLRESLRPICETLTIAPAPRVIRLRTVQHLCTDVSARTSERHGILSLVEVLHPTPAVGGQPREAALDLMRDQERIDRGWYAGPLGWLDRDGDGEFVVALRSGVLRGERASLFAGCGIVADSDAGREWEESRIKLRALGSALGGVEL